MIDRHVDELIDLYALGALEPGEQTLVDRHLGTCRQCRARLEEAEHVVAHLAWVPDQYDPPAELQYKVRRRIEQLQHAEDTARSHQVATARRHASLWWRGAAAVATLLVLLLGSWSFVLQRRIDMLQAQIAASEQLDALLQAPGARLIELTAQPAAPNARGALIIDPDGTRGYLVAAGLPVLSSGQSYQLWLQEGAARTSGGVFRADDDGAATLVVRSSQPLGTYTGCGITIEPAGGSPAPTGDRVLRSVQWEPQPGETTW